MPRVTRSSAKNGHGLFDFIGVAIANGNVKYDIPEQYQHLLPSHLQQANDDETAAAAPDLLFIHSSAKGTYVEKDKKATAMDERANKIAAAASTHATKVKTAKQGKGGLDINLVLPYGGRGVGVSVGKRRGKGKVPKAGAAAGKKDGDKKRKLERIEEVDDEQYEDSDEEEEEEEKDEDEEYVPDGKPPAKKKQRRTAKATPRRKQQSVVKVAAPKKGGRKKKAEAEAKAKVGAAALASEKKEAEEEKKDTGGEKKVKETVQLEVAVVAVVEGNQDKEEEKGEEKEGEKGEEREKEEAGDGNVDENYGQQDRNPDAEPEE